MALTKTIEVDKIEVIGEYSHVQVRTATVIKEGGKELSRSFNRHVLPPAVWTSEAWADTDISGETAEVQGVCNAVWTDAIKTAWKAKIEADMAS
tara:strand:+ start:1168 stop:1449 length:282 start_codon:yes stop_codon:yes gene_type:complete